MWFCVFRLSVKWLKSIKFIPCSYAIQYALEGKLHLLHDETPHWIANGNEKEKSIVCQSTQKLKLLDVSCDENYKF